jgi:hypothetical protein
MFETLKLTLFILPLIVELVQRLETAFPHSGLGKMKASLVNETVAAAAKDISPELVQKIIDVVVRVFKAFGIMK